MRVFAFLIVAVATACCFSFIVSWPSWTSAVVVIVSVILFWVLRPNPKPVWWFPGFTLLLMSVGVFVFNLIASLNGASKRLPFYCLAFGVMLLAEAAWRRRLSGNKGIHSS